MFIFQAFAALSLLAYNAMHKTAGSAGSGMAVHWTQTQQLFCHFDLVINTPDESGSVCAFVKRHRLCTENSSFVT